MNELPGRFCPTHYRYGAEALATAPVLYTDTLIVAGGLYGNLEALDALEMLVAEEHATLIYNGDFHWFDAETDAFATVQRRVLAHSAIAGNVEVAAASGAGCGCAYPARVDDTTVERANAIIERLREASPPRDRQQLEQLPYFLQTEVGGHRVAIIHGDPDSLAGWGLDAEALGPEGSTTVARLTDWFRRAQADVFACSHTCLPYAWALEVDGRARAVINNGAAGMPNFRGDLRGIVTRIATTPSPRALYRAILPQAVAEAVPLAYDVPSWLTRFERWWPPGSPAYESYRARLTKGPTFSLVRAIPTDLCASDDKSLP